MKRFCVLLMFMAMLFTGCTAPVKIESRLIVQGIGIDFAEGRFRVSVQTYLPGTPQGGGKTQLFTQEGGRLSDCFLNLEQESGRQLFLGNCRMVLLGEQAAEQKWEEISDFLLSDHELRPTVSLLLAVPGAEQVLQVENARELQLRAAESARQGLCMESTFLSVLRSMESLGGCAAVVQFSLPQEQTPPEPKPQEESSSAAVAEQPQEPQLRLSQRVLFPGRLSPELNLEQSQGLALLGGKVQQMQLSLPSEDGYFTVQLTPRLKTMQAQEQGSTAVLQLRLRLDCAVLEAVGKPVQEKELPQLVQSLAGQAVQERLRRAESWIKEQQADTVLILEHIKKFCPALFARYSGRMDTLLEQIMLEPTAEIRVTSLGLSYGVA